VRPREMQWREIAGLGHKRISGASPGGRLALTAQRAATGRRDARILRRNLTQTGKSTSSSASPAFPQDVSPHFNSPHKDLSFPSSSPKTKV